MKKCTYCGKEYTDEVTTCVIDGQPVTSGGKPAAPAPKMSAAPAADAVKPALIVRLRVWHLYLGCFFAPMLLFFAISGIWQTIGLHGQPGGTLAKLSSVHMNSKMKSGGGWNSGWMMIFVLLMSVAFITTTILGIVMAVNYGKNRKVAYGCLALGVIVPVLLVVIRLL